MKRKTSRQAVRRRSDDQTSRQSLRIAGYALAGLTVVLVAVGSYSLIEWLRDPRAWPIRQVRIEGKFHNLTRDQIADATQAMLRHGFFGIQVKEVRSRLAELPWVDEVAVRRIWPDGLQLSIQEQVPVARWGDDGLLNAQGEYFAPDNVAEFAVLPRLAGPDTLRERVIRRYIDFRHSLAGINRYLTSIELNERRAWRVELDNGMQIRLGRDAEVQRMALFINVYPQVFAHAQNPAKSVDMRYSNGFAVQWQSPKTAERQEG